MEGQPSDSILRQLSVSTGFMIAVEHRNPKDPSVTTTTLTSLILRDMCLLALLLGFPPRSPSKSQGIIVGYFQEDRRSVHTLALSTGSNPTPLAMACSL
jgi:hypothetical protein